MKYPLAPQGVYKSIQGEGVLLGEPTVFVRFAGCSVGCPECDTDYSVAYELGFDALLQSIINCDPAEGRWVWLTGGEPTVQDIWPLVSRLNAIGYRTALATAGVNPVRAGHAKELGGVSFVSVSPHKIDKSWVVRRGDQLNIVPGLNGLRLSDLDGVDVSGFSHRFVTPMNAGLVAECAEWVKAHAGWRLGVQAHKTWRLP